MPWDNITVYSETKFFPSRTLWNGEAGNCTGRIMVTCEQFELFRSHRFALLLTVYQDDSGWECSEDATECREIILEAGLDQAAAIRQAIALIDEAVAQYTARSVSHSRAAIYSNVEVW